MVSSFYSFLVFLHVPFCNTEQTLGLLLKRRSGLEGPQTSSTLDFVSQRLSIFHPWSMTMISLSYPSPQLTSARCVVPPYAGVTRVSIEVGHTVLLKMHWMNSCLCVLRCSSLSLETSLSPQ